MNISLFLGFGVLWHWVGRLVYVFLVYLVLVLCWNKFGAFDVSCISRWIWLIWTVRDLVCTGIYLGGGRDVGLWMVLRFFGIRKWITEGACRCGLWSHQTEDGHIAH